MKFLKVVLLIFLLKSGIAQAQVCTGSLGDPIINVDFGSSAATTGSALASGVTTYKFVTGTPNDGEYTIVHTTANMHPTTWWQTTDHTGNSNGYMMVVNASITADNFYKQTITGLCPGTTYEFAAWILNLIRGGGINPNITFTITDATGNSKVFKTNEIPEASSPTWKQYGTFFTTPATGGDVVLTMTNNASGGNGNDLLLDDITFRACGPMVNSNFSSTASGTINACAGDNASYIMSASVSSSSYTAPMYQWQTYQNGAWADIAGATTTTYQANFMPAVAGTYQYRLAVGDGVNVLSPTCRVVSNVLTVTINTPPSSTVTGTTAVCEGDIISLTASAGDSYSWTGPNGYTSTQQNMVVNSAAMANAGTYNVTVIKLGCSTSASIPVGVKPKPKASVSSNVTICAGASTILNASGGVGYQWLPATGLSDAASASPVATPSDTTTYSVVVTNAAGCTDTAKVTVNVIKLPAPNAGADGKISEGQAITLSGSIKGNYLSYYWTPTSYLSNVNSLNPVAEPVEDFTYTLHAVSTCGEVTDDVFVRVYKKIVIPTAFTPNNDGYNDTWRIDALETYPESITQVFNRNGQLVFSSKGYTKAWDGRFRGETLPTGTYYYTIDLKRGPILSGFVLIIK